jgi:hypothetical protein
MLPSLPDLLCVEDNKSTGKSKLTFCAWLKQFYRCTYHHNFLTNKKCGKDKENVIPGIAHAGMQLLQSWALENSFLQRYEIQSTGTMKEGTVPVPPYRPCAQER